MNSHHSPARLAKQLDLIEPAEPNSFVAALRMLFRHLPPSRRRAVIPLMALMLAGAGAELFTLGALLPFLAVISAPEGSPILSTARPLLDFVGASSPQQELYALAGICALAVVVIEGAGVIMIMLVAISMTWRSGRFASAIPLLGAFALGAQRLLPLIQQIYHGWAAALGGKQLMVDIAMLLNRPILGSEKPSGPLSFRSSIVLADIGYTYSRSKLPTLEGVNLEIPKGARVGISGKTGSGKSILMDLVLGLLEPTRGEIRVDGAALTTANRASWQRNVAHVPQEIFLSDASVAENIAFGVKTADIDMQRVREAAEQAMIRQTRTKGLKVIVTNRMADDLAGGRAKAFAGDAFGGD